MMIALIVGATLAQGIELVYNGRKEEPSIAVYAVEADGSTFYAINSRVWITGTGNKFLDVFFGHGYGSVADAQRHAEDVMPLPIFGEPASSDQYSLTPFERVVLRKLTPSECDELRAALDKEGRKFSSKYEPLTVIAQLLTQERCSVYARTVAGETVYCVSAPYLLSRNQIRIRSIAELALQIPEGMTVTNGWSTASVLLDLRALTREEAAQLRSGSEKRSRK